MLFSVVPTSLNHSCSTCTVSVDSAGFLVPSESVLNRKLANRNAHVCLRVRLGLDEFTYTHFEGAKRCDSPRCANGRLNKT